MSDIKDEDSSLTCYWSLNPVWWVRYEHWQNHEQDPYYQVLQITLFHKVISISEIIFITAFFISYSLILPPSVCIVHLMGHDSLIERPPLICLRKNHKRQHKVVLSSRSMLVLHQAPFACWMSYVQSQAHSSLCLRAPKYAVCGSIPCTWGYEKHQHWLRMPSISLWSSSTPTIPIYHSILHRFSEMLCHSTDNQLMHHTAPHLSRFNISSKRAFHLSPHNIIYGISSPLGFLILPTAPSSPLLHQCPTCLLFDHLWLLEILTDNLLKGRVITICNANDGLQPEIIPFDNQN